MKEYAGIDVSLEYSSVCVVDADGRIVREAKILPMRSKGRQDRLSDGHSHQPSAARSLRRDDKWVRPLCDQQQKGDCASKRLANRSSADPIEQRQSSDCGHMWTAPSLQGIDATPVTEDRIMYRVECSALSERSIPLQLPQDRVAADWHAQPSHPSAIQDFRRHYGRAD